MALIDDLAVAQAIASRATTYGAPSGYALRKVHATPPDSLGIVPAVVVFPESDAMTYGAANRSTTLRFTVRCYLLPQADASRRFADLLTWRGHLRDMLIGSVTLGGLVHQASVTATTLGSEVYADQDYLTVDLAVEVAKVEAIGAVA